MLRTLRRDAPEWLEGCGWCGAMDVEQRTFPDCPPESVYDGDDLTCRECGATGVCWVDEQDMAGSSQWDGPEEALEDGVVAQDK